MESANQFFAAIRQMIQISKSEQLSFLELIQERDYKKNEIISKPNVIPNEIFFICKGLLRITITDKEGIEHCIHFAMENEFIADYSAFLLKQKSNYTIQAVESTRVIVLPRETVDWGYMNLKQGERMGRLIAEYYFIYHDNRINNLYTYSPKERYDNIAKVFPNIHNRIPQHMIASYLGITPIHLSRLKKNAIHKK